MLDEVDKVEKKEIKLFLRQLYEDTKAKKISWHRFSNSNNSEILDDTRGIINYNLSFVAKIGDLGEIFLFYCIDTSDYDNGYIILPEIHTQGDVLFLPCDPMTQRLLKRIYSLLEKEQPSQSMQRLSEFLKK